MEHGREIADGIHVCECSYHGDRLDREINLCGCGELHKLAYTGVLYHYDDKHWRPECLIRNLAELIKATNLDYP